MKRLVAALCLVLLMIGSASGAVLPWKTFSEATPFTTHSVLGNCKPGQEVFVAHLADPVSKAEHRFWFSPETQKLIWAVYTTSPILLDEVGFGVMGENSDQIPALRWETFDLEIHRNPCTFLFPESA